MPSGSDSDSSRSGSPSPSLNQPVPTPGHGLDQGSRSNSPFNQSGSRPGSQASNRSRSGSGSNRSRSPSAETNRSRSQASGSRSRSNSPGSNRSKSPGSNRSRSKTPGSYRSQSAGSNKSNRSNSGDSRRSRSKTPASRRSRSKSGASNRSGSNVSGRSGSAGSRRSGSVRTARSGSRRSGTPHSQRSGSAHSRRSGSAHSRRSGSAHSQRSGSAHSRRSGSPHSRRSGSAHSRRSGSRTPSNNRQRDDSRSNSPNLQIDAGSNASSPNSEVGKKRKNEATDESTRKRKLIDTDSEPEEPTQPNADAAELFGDADDISSDEEKEDKAEKEDQRQSDRDERDDDERERGGRSDEEETNEQRAPEEEEEKEPEPIPETRIDVEIPKITTDLGRDIHFVKLPNFLSVETRPFDQETYEDEIDEEETLDEEGRARLKLKVENTIRWREIFDKDGNVQRESNARFIKWSDGSLSLHLGAEIFDVYKQPLQGDHNHLFIRQGTGLQGQAVFRTKLTFRPHSTESFTHRKMTLSLADRSQKTSGIKILSQVGVDPDQDRKTLLKKEEEKLRQTARTTKPRKRGDTIARAHIGTNVFREEEGSDEEGAISLAAIKNKYKSGGGNSKSGANIYSSDEEGSDFEARRVKKVDKSKAIRDSDSESHESD